MRLGIQTLEKCSPSKAGEISVKKMFFFAFLNFFLTSRCCTNTVRARWFLQTFTSVVGFCAFHGDFTGSHH